MDARTDGWRYEWKEGHMDGGTYGWMDGWMFGCMGMDVCTEDLMCAWMDA